jgi:hypothetical protein
MTQKWVLPIKRFRWSTQPGALARVLALFDDKAK